MDKISVVIPTVNRYSYLSKAIDSLVDNSLEYIDEIIIIDQTPEQKFNRKFYDSYSNKYDFIRYVKLEHMGQSTARNHGIDISRNELVYLFDDDSIATDDIIFHHLKIRKKYINPCTTGLSHAAYKDRGMIDKNFTIEKYTTVFDSGNSLITKTAWRTIGGFDKAFDRGMGADSDFGTRLFLNGIEVVQAPDAIRIHLKADEGGLRTHGATWMHSYKIFSPFPPVHTTYQLSKYYSGFNLFLNLFSFLVVSVKNNLSIKSVVLIIFSPIYFLHSIYKSKSVNK